MQYQLLQYNRSEVGIVGAIAVWLYQAPQPLYLIFYIHPYRIKNSKLLKLQVFCPIQVLSLPQITITIFHVKLKRTKHSNIALQSYYLILTRHLQQFHKSISFSNYSTIYFTENRYTFLCSLQRLLNLPLKRYFTT